MAARENSHSRNTGQVHGSVRYIGSKQRLLASIMEILGAPSVPGSRFVDAFCGTGVVAAAAADAGWPVEVNDQLKSAITMAVGRVISRDDALFAGLGGYEAAIAKLNDSRDHDGFIWREYSPASASFGEDKIERRYFTEDNARRIDGVRREISAQRRAGRLSETEACLLIADLLAAVSRVANTAGTYGCFLAQFQNGALNPLVLAPRSLRQKHAPLGIHNVDVFNLALRPDDVAYFDPPYTKRQYAAYYHILETITIGDEPEVHGITRLRPWKHLASPFCYKQKAQAALLQLVEQTRANRILLSYSNEGHVDLKSLCSELGRLGEVKIHEVASIGRYRPNRAASIRQSSVSEFLLEIIKTDSK